MVQVDVTRWHKLALNTEGTKVAVAGYYVTGSPDPTPPTYQIIPIDNTPANIPPVKPVNNPPATTPEVPAQTTEPTVSPGNDSSNASQNTQSTSTSATVGGDSGNAANNTGSGGTSSELGAIFAYTGDAFSFIDGGRRVALGALDAGIGWSKEFLNQTDAQIGQMDNQTASSTVNRASAHAKKKHGAVATASVATLLFTLTGVRYVVGNPWAFYPTALGVLLALVLFIVIRRHHIAESEEAEIDARLNEF